jgi:hypothetical protein
VAEPSLRVIAAGYRERASGTAGVEYALRSDELLTDADVRDIMNRYLAARRTRILRGGPPERDAPDVTAARQGPVPIVVKIPRATRRPTQPRDR